ARQVDRLLEQGLVDPSSRVVVAGNQLVLAGPEPSKDLRFADLASLAPGQLLAMGDPDTAPVGRYARDYLQALGIWPAVKQRAVYASSTAAVLAYARRGEVTAAIVYDSDLLTVDDLLLLDRARPGLATQPLLVAALSADAPRELADFLSFVVSQAGQKVLAEYGFLPPPGDTR
ncbi:MAG: molybdate ABC transporter substrate-binding protein, partial [bacterium]